MDISSLRERNGAEPFSVGALNGYIRSMFEGDRTLSALSVRGEISNFVAHRSGHLYFTLKDEESQIRAVMFRSAASSLRFLPENGMKVVVRGSVSLYVRDGTYQIYVNAMRPDGVGALYLAYEQRKRKLEEEGLFAPEHKKPIPPFPRRVGVITSPTGAAVRDIIHVTGRRYPATTIYLYPALVQGAEAEESLCTALDRLDQSQLCDVIIIGRGGGSLEDLFAFNGEHLARRIYAARTPIISAVGHETDFTICDFVADLRAPTPSAAAELAVPDARDLLLRIDDLAHRATVALCRGTERRADHLRALASRPCLTDPASLFDTQAIRLGALRSSLFSLASHDLGERTAALSLLAEKLNVLSPLAVLGRGYAVAQKGGEILRSVHDVAPGDAVGVYLPDGRLETQVTRIAGTNIGKEKKRAEIQEK